MNKIKEIQVITQPGPRHFVLGQHFDYVDEIQTGIDTVRYVLYKDQKLVTTISDNVPVVVDYESN